MTTTLKPGTAIVFRQNGQHELWCVAPGGGGYTGVAEPLKAGDEVHFVVWKGREIHVRKSYTLQAGDVRWVDTGLPGIDLTKPPTIFGYARSGKNIFRNEFVGGPAWLREAK